jgi:hypothetical protein
MRSTNGRSGLMSAETPGIHVTGGAAGCRAEAMTNVMGVSYRDQQQRLNAAASYAGRRRLQSVGDCTAQFKHGQGPSDASAWKAGDSAPPIPERFRHAVTSESGTA